MIFHRVFNILFWVVFCQSFVFGFSPDYFTMSGSGTYDLSIEKVSTLPGPFSAGQDVTFTITVTNEGNCDASNIQITDFLPNSLFLSAMDNNGWMLSGNDIINTIPFISSAIGSNQVSIPVVLTIDPLFTGTSIDNQAAITIDDGDDIDSDPMLGFDDDDNGDGNTLDDDESIATIQISPIMSLESIEFTIESDGMSDILHWNIASDFDIDKFELQLLADVFNTIGEVDAIDGIADYSQAWYPKMNKERYYRIKAYLPSGDIKYTKVLIGKVYEDHTTFGIFPNPANDLFTVYSNSEDLVQIEIFDSSGQIVLRKDLLCDNRVDVSSLQQNLYFIRVKSSGKPYVWTRLVVSH